MRRCIFGWMALAIAAATSVGCSGSGGDASNYVVPDIHPISDSQKSVSYLVPDCKSDDICRLVISTNAKTTDDNETRDISVSSDIDYSAVNSSSSIDSDPTGTPTPAPKINGASAKEGDEDDASYVPIACGFAEAAEDIVSVEDNNAAARFDSLDVGNIEPIWVALGGTARKIYVAKVAGNEDTKYCNVLSYAQYNDDTAIYEPSVSEDDAKLIAKIFDEEIYEQVTGVCGTEWKTGGGRDLDSKVNIVLLNSEQMSKGEDKGEAYGFVSARDLLPEVQNEHSSLTKQNYSNHGEYVYINYELLLSDEEGSENCVRENVKSILAHEFVHLTQLNQKVAKNGAFTNLGVPTPYSSVEELQNAVGEPVLAEGFAELGAELCLSGVYNAANSTGDKAASMYSLDPIVRYMNGTTLLDSTDFTVSTCFPHAFFDKESNDTTGMGHLFALHVLGYYGKDKLKSVYTSSNTGIDMLEEALGEPINDIMHRYDMAVSLSGAEEIPDPYTKYAIPYVNFGGVNSYWTTTGVGNISINRALDLTDRAVYPKLTASQFKVLPWYNCFLSMFSNADAALSIDATVPKTAQVNLIHADKDGIIKNIY
ncbi:MAG: hypothetical protein ACI38Q_02945 [Candidatus Bruticola sp.]